MNGRFRQLRLLGRICTVCGALIEYGPRLIQLRQHLFAAELLRHFILRIELYGEFLIFQIIRGVRYPCNLTLLKCKMLVHVQSRQPSRQYGKQKDNQANMYYIGSPAAKTVLLGQ
ncbi:hypothetical protein D3C73_1050120 [compost metagenome]